MSTINGSHGFVTAAPHKEPNTEEGGKAILITAGHKAHGSGCALLSLPQARELAAELMAYADAIEKGIDRHGPTPARPDGGLFGVPLPSSVPEKA